MAKESKAISVITIPLKTEIWQEDVLDKRFETCRNIYNAMLGKKLKDYNKMLRDKDYIASKSVINKAYKDDDGNNVPDKIAKEIKKSVEYKEAQAMQRELLKKYNFSEFGFVTESMSASEHFRNVIPTKIAEKSIAKPMWAAFDKLLFGNAKTVHFKKYGTFSSIASDAKSGIRIVTEDEKTVLNMGDNVQYYIFMKSKTGKKLKLPLMVNHKDTYLLEMMCNDVRMVRITRKKVKDRYHYFAQMTVAGTPALKYNEDGTEKNPVKEGKLGVYIDTTSVTVFNGKDKFEYKFQKYDEDDRIAGLQRYMDTSKRLSNPENFNKDGTIKKGIVEDGKKRKLRWTYSHGYIKARNEVANLKRIAAEKRKIRSGELTNLVLSMGTEVTINDFPFQQAAMRKKEDELTKAGTPKAKSKAGKAIGENAPAAIVTQLDNKLKARGYCGVKKVKLSDINYAIEDYRANCAMFLYNA